MIRSSRLMCLFVLLLPLSAAADLGADVESVLADKLLRRATVGVEVVRLGASEKGTQLIYAHNAERRFIPASNLKVVTTSAALDRLGPDFKFRTTLLLHGNDLVLIGDGDPSLGDAELLKKSDWGTTTVFQNWAEALKKRGVIGVNNVIVDDSVFEETSLHPRWPADQLHKRYVAEVGGVNLNANCIDFQIRTGGPGEVVGYSMDPDTRFVTVRNTCTTGQQNAIWLSREPGGNSVILRGETPHSTQVPVSVTVHDPSMFAATVLAETMAAHGVKVTGGVSRDRTLRRQRDEAGARGAGQWSVVAIHETPLSTVLARANKDSMNLYAESLCKRLGFDVSRVSGSWENGTAAVGALLRRAGVPDEQFTLDDGSGLSKENGISPHAMARVLEYDYFGRNRDAFIASLAVAGVDGTLDDRFVHSDLRGRVFGKSGFVEGVSCLSGYLKTRDGEMYAFSILMNGIPRLSNSAIKPLQEKIVKSIDAHATTVAAGQ